MALSYTDQLCCITGSNTTFWGSEFSMELLLILFVLVLMRQNIGSASEIDLIYILQKTSRLVTDFNNFQQSSTRIKVICIFYHFQILTIPLHHILVFFFSLFLYKISFPVSTWKTFTVMFSKSCCHRGVVLPQLGKSLCSQNRRRKGLYLA